MSSFAKNYLCKAYDVTEGKIVEIPRGAQPLASAVDYAKKEPSVVYSGSLSRHENLALYLKSMRHVTEKCSCKFYLTGKGYFKPQLEKLSKKYSANSQFLWFPKKAKCQEFISHCSVGVVPWARTFSRRFGFPIKMLDYFAVGLPVVITDIGEWSDFVRNERLGVVTDDTPRGFAEGILAVLNDADFAEESGQRALSLIKKTYNWENTARIMAQQYQLLRK